MVVVALGVGGKDASDDAVIKLVRRAGSKRAFMVCSGSDVEPIGQAVSR